MAFPKTVLLWSDAVVLLVLLALIVYGVHVRRTETLRATWLKVFRDPAALCSTVLLLLFFALAIVDSLHFRRALSAAGGQQQQQAYGTRTESVLDLLLARQIDGRETSYSSPLATRSFSKDSREIAGQAERIFPRLQFGGAHLRDDAAEWAGDVARRTLAGLGLGLLAAAAIAGAVAVGLARAHRIRIGDAARRLWRDDTDLPWRAALVTVGLVSLLIGPAFALAQHYHVFGTDRTGNDVFYQALKSIRTAFVIGTLSTIATLPFALVFGIAAGYLKGWVDEVIQYLYTTLSSVPNVLLIAACVLMMQVFIDTHPDLFETGAERADVRLFLLCVILGLTGWATLCRLLRAETMKLRELDYVQAATAFGVGHGRIMRRHIFPNVVHLIIITTVLDFSALILYEAVLSYVGVGVDPSMNSFGGMINLARNEMSRDPVVWWPFVAAFGFMVAVVLAANL
ncbi:MAG TPA: ABC transporter permease, partial [Albitalea sp.]|nr:ABC transporter permease [Albitalea sp.]